MSIPKDWTIFRELGSSPEATVLGAFLELNGVPVHLERFSELPGLESGAFVAVPQSMLHRARWLTAAQDVTEDELAALATALPAEGGAAGR